jgi:hypothetical protein
MFVVLIGKGSIVKNCLIGLLCLFSVTQVLADGFAGSTPYTIRNGSDKTLYYWQFFNIDNKNRRFSLIDNNAYKHENIPYGAKHGPLKPFVPQESRGFWADPITYYFYVTDNPTGEKEIDESFLAQAVPVQIKDGSIVVFSEVGNGKFVARAAKGYCHIKGTAIALERNWFRRPPEKLKKMEMTATANYVLAQEHAITNGQICRDLLGEDSDGEYFNTDLPFDQLYGRYGLKRLTDKCGENSTGQECFCENTKQLGICLKPLYGSTPICNCNTPLASGELVKFGITDNGKHLKTDEACAGKYNNAECECSNVKDSKGICGINRNPMPGMAKHTLYCHCD